MKLQAIAAMILALTPAMARTPLAYELRDSA